MAIQSENNAGAQSGGSQTFGTAAPQASSAINAALGTGSGASAASASDNPFGFTGVLLNPGMLANSVIRSQIGAEQYEKLIKEIREIVKDNVTNPAVEVDILTLDRSVDTNLHYLGFVVTSRSKQRPELGVGYHICLLENTGTPLTAVEETNSYGNETIQIPRYAEQAASVRLDEIARQLMVTKYGNVPMYRSDTEIIGSSFEHTNSAAVRSVVDNASRAAQSSLLMLADGGRFFTKDFDLVNTLRPNGKSRNNAEFDMTFIIGSNPRVMYNHLNQPIRASLSVTAVTGTPRNRKPNYDPNDGDGPKTILETAGFVDLMPSAPRPLNPMMMVNPATGQFDQRRLSPVFVITSPISNFSCTPSAVIMNVLAAAELNKNTNWVRQFSRRNRTSENTANLPYDLEDVTKITLDFPDPTNPSKPTPSPDPKMVLGADQPLMQFLGTYCSQDLTIAMDVPMAGPSTWYLSLFALAASGNPAAIERINKSANDLTGGRLLASGAAALPPIFAPDVMDGEQGWWDCRGTIRTSDDVDYTAVCAYADFQNNPEIIERYTNSFLQTSVPLARRLQDRRAIQREILGPSLTMTHRFRRIFWNGAWMVRVMQALSEAGITISGDGGSGYAFGAQRAFASFLNQAALPQSAGWSYGSAHTPFGFGGFSSSPWAAATGGQGNTNMGGGI